MTSDVEGLRALLGRTGVLQTPTGNDPGHLSGLWRKRITELLDTIENGGVAATAQLEPEDESLREVEALLTRVQVGLFGALPAERLVRAHYLVEQALPRMRSLNNEMSPGWVQIAEDFLAGRSS